MSHGHHHHHDDHDHHHHHASAAGAAGRRALTIALVLNGAFLIVEGGLGLWTGSLALLSDAAHMTSDVAALALALGAAHLATRDASADRSFGLVRAETLGAFVNGLALLLVCALIAREAIVRLTSVAPDVAPLPVLVAGAIGLVINVGSAVALYRADREDLNIRGALVHMIADALGSVGAMVAAALLWFGLPAADAVMGLVIAALVLYGTVGLLRDSGRVLLQFAPRRVPVDALRAAVASVHGVDSVHELHCWSVDGRDAVLSAHLVARHDADLRDVRQAVEGLLDHEFGITHTTLQVESAGVDSCPPGDCVLARRAAHG